MKKINLLTLLLLIVSLGFSQRSFDQKAFDQSGEWPASTFRAAVDTLEPGSVDLPCFGDGLFVYTDNTGLGYVFGNNGYGDKEKAQRLLLPGSGTGTLSEVLWFWGALAVGDNGSLTVKAYEVDAGTEGPGALLGESEIVRIIAVDTAAGFNVFTFTTPPSFTDELFVSLDLTALLPGDTVSGVGTDDGCGTGCFAWEKFSDDSWVSMCDASSWAFTDVDMFVLAVVDWTAVSGIGDDFVTQGSLSLHPAYPNPAVNRTSINFTLNESSKVSIQVFDMTGKMYVNTDLGKIAAGKQSVDLDLEKLGNGTYFYSVITDNGRLNSKFIIEK